MRSQKGITLIELIIIMVIIAIGATLMIPGIGSWLPYYHLRNASREIASTMRLAQMKAISNNLSYQITFDTENKSYTVRSVSGEDIVAEGRLRDDLQLETNFLGNVAIFRPDLTVNNYDGSILNDGRIRVTNSKGQQKTIRLQGGRIRLE